MSFFSEPATPVMEGIIDLHNLIMYYLILFFVIFVFGEIIWLFYIRQTFPKNIEEELAFLLQYLKSKMLVVSLKV